MAFMAMDTLSAGGNAVQDVAYDVLAGRPMCHVPVHQWMQMQWKLQKFVTTTYLNIFLENL
jgi:hypothetical protein